MSANPRDAKVTFFYHEGSREIPFYWEYGCGDVVVVCRFDQPGQIALRYPWATERTHEILERVARELIRQRAPGGIAEIDEENLRIYVRLKDSKEAGR